MSSEAQQVSLGPTQTRVLQLLQDIDGQATMPDIIEHAAPEIELSYEALRSAIGRLRRSGYVESEKFADGYHAEYWVTDLAPEVGPPDIHVSKPPCKTTKFNRVHQSGWCRHFDVIPPLIPFGGRTYDPVEYLLDVREAIADAPPTKATFRTSELTEDLGYDLTQKRDLPTLLRAAGLWEYVETSRHNHRGGVLRWVNPQYVHASSARPITDRQDRLEEIRRAASLGALSLSDIAPRLGGETKHTAYKVCSRAGISWTEWRDWGRGRLMRTAAIIHRWTHYSWSTIAEAFGVDEVTFLRWRDRYAPEFEVPGDPTGEWWFETYSNERRQSQ
jgi:hypothetical protein